MLIFFVLGNYKIWLLCKLNISETVEHNIDKTEAFKTHFNTAENFKLILSLLYEMEEFSV